MHTYTDKELLTHFHIPNMMEELERNMVSKSRRNEIVKAYALCERALIYDWCISNGDYSLCQYAKTMMPTSAVIIPALMSVLSSNFIEAKPAITLPSIIPP